LTVTAEEGKVTIKLSIRMEMRKVISLYTGAGGLDLGLDAAGFTTTVAVEYNGPACRTLRANRSEERPWEVIEASIHDVSSNQLSVAGRVKAGDPDLLVGGPPCQPFSKSAYWVHGDTKRLADPRADTLSAYLRVLRDLQPRVFLLENVFGLTYKGKDEALRLLQNTVQAINRDVGTNYSFCWKVLNTANYGVPQVRERFFLVGARDGREFTFPEPTHAENPSEAGAGRADPTDQMALFAGGGWGSPEPWRTAWDALGDLDPEVVEGLQVTGKWGDLLASIPEGKNYLHHTDRGDGLSLFGWRRRYWTFLLKLAKDRPSWTLQAQPGAGIGPFHWKNRRLSVTEMMRIQTFPDGYTIEGGHTEAVRQLGNAVPSLMTEVLGREIRRQLLDDPIESPLRLIPPKRSPVPPPEELLPVPEKYLIYIGDHTPHPGTGKGRLAYSEEELEAADL
jgi:DNA (cytosine-5)-methyltransferase 1